MSCKSIPLIFAITGHRDLLDEDIVLLKAKVEVTFKVYQDKYPYTNIVLLSALAEGADMLVAEVAQSLGIAINVILPYEKEAYLNSFENEKSKVQFQNIFEKANQLITLKSDKKEPSACYDMLGKHLADNCNILLALWDGVDSGKIGGTSEVVKYMRQGNLNNHFDLVDGNALITINTPRKSNTNISNPLKVNQDFLINSKEEFHKILKKINDVNTKFGVFANDNQDKTLINNAYDFFNELANNKQSDYKKYFKWILISSFVAFASLETMHILKIEGWTFGYGLGLIIAFIVYKFRLGDGKIQEDFVYARAFSETLRVQNAWNHAKIKPKDNWQTHESIANYYLADSHHKFTWLKIAIKNISYLDNTMFNSEAQYNVKHYDENTWIDGQAKYFSNNFIKQSRLDYVQSIFIDAINRIFRTKVKSKSISRITKLEFWEKIERFFYYFGLGSMLLMFIIFILEYIHFIEHGEWWFNWHYLILISGISLLAAAFIGEKYLKIEGFEEELYDFELMHRHFKKAQDLLKNTNKDTEKYNKIIFDLGIKALSENGKWVVLHDARRAGFSVD